MELDPDVDMARTDAAIPVSTYRTETSELDERGAGRQPGLSERVRGNTDPRRPARVHGAGPHGERGDGAQHVLKLADMGFYNAFGDDLDEADMKLSGCPPGLSLKAQ